MDFRELRALELAARVRIVHVGDGVWTVPSQSSISVSYRVRLDPLACECEDFQTRQLPCKHVLAVRFVNERQGGEQAPAVDTTTIPVKKKYTQENAAYNRAQAIEKRRMQELLKDLASRLPERERPSSRPGPKPHLVRDCIMAMALKVFCGISSRRFSTDLDTAFEKGYVTKKIPGAKVTAFFEDSYFTPILKDLIAFSATPLRPIETKFAIDSSGFSSCRYESFFDHKYGVTRRKCQWTKCHIASGVSTHCVSAVRILDKDAADCPQFIPLLRETKNGFEISEVSADKAYTSLENFEEIAACGAQGYLAFKINTTGGVGGKFEEAFFDFQANRERYLEKYHLRSNVESTFSAVKRKYGHAVMSKTDTAMVNESLCKFLCHNLSCLVHAQEKLGIVPKFWKDEPVPVIDAAPAILAFPAPG